MPSIFSPFQMRILTSTSHTHTHTCSHTISMPWCSAPDSGFAESLARKWLKMLRWDTSTKLSCLKVRFCFVFVWVGFVLFAFWFVCFWFVDCFHHSLLSSPISIQGGGTKAMQRFVGSSVGQSPKVCPPFADLFLSFFLSLFPFFNLIIFNEFAIFFFEKKKPKHSNLSASKALAISRFLASTRPLGKKVCRKERVFVKSCNLLCVVGVVLRLNFGNGWLYYHAHPLFLISALPQHHDAHRRHPARKQCANPHKMQPRANPNPECRPFTACCGVYRVLVLMIIMNGDDGGDDGGDCGDKWWWWW